MILPSTGTIEHVSAPPLVPVDQPIDLAHLARMTLGEPSLEREVLQLFCRQAEMLLQRMQSAPPPVVAAVAHTMKGSARGIGAWHVAAAAEALERVASADATGVPSALAELSACIDEATVAIAELLRRH